MPSRVDSVSLREDIYVLLCTLPTCAFALVQLLPYVSAQYAAAALFGPSRSLLWACYFHFYQNAARYPPAMIGRLYGYSNLVIAAIGDGPPELLHKFVVNNVTFGDTRDATAQRYVALHAVLAVPILLTALALPAVLFAQRRTHRRMLREHERANAAATGSGLLAELPSAAGPDPSSTSSSSGVVPLVAAGGM